MVVTMELMATALADTTVTLDCMATTMVSPPITQSRDLMVPVLPLDLTIRSAEEWAQACKAHTPMASAPTVSRVPRSSMVLPRLLALDSLEASTTLEQ